MISGGGNGGGGPGGGGGSSEGGGGGGWATKSRLIPIDITVSKFAKRKYYCGRRFVGYYMTMTYHLALDAGHWEWRV